MKQTESGLQSAIKDYITMAYPDALILRTNSGGAKTDTGRWVWFIRWWARRVVDDEQHAGACDVHAIYLGKFVAIECKIGNNKPSKEQLKYAEAVERAGGEYCLAYSLDDVVKCFDDLETRMLLERDRLDRLQQIADEFSGK